MRTYDHHIRTWRSVNRAIGTRTGHLDHLRRGHLNDQHEHAAYDHWLREHASERVEPSPPTSRTVALRDANRERAARLGVSL